MLISLGLLLVLFRQIERWLHQHIFKVGWLVTNSFQVTTVLYYIFLLPGILLHEATLWLAASILRVRTERAIGFPAEQEIGELRLNFVSLSPEAGLVRYSLAKLAPVVAGSICLWLIALHVFNWPATAAIAALGSIDDLARAVARVTTTADFWLWFYLAFTIANTMFPASRRKLGGRQKSLLAIAAGALISLLWLIGGAFEANISHGIESLFFGLALVLSQTIAFNIAVVLILGVIEAALERVTGKSATFIDGKMIAMSRSEAQSRERPISHRKPPSDAKAKTISSIYEMKLPIPGPPGREPVSRSAVSVVSAREDVSNHEQRINDKQQPASLGQPPALEITRAPQDSQARAILGSAAPVSKDKSAIPNRAKQPPGMDATRPDESSGEGAPFSRPFADADKVQGGDDRADGDEANATGGYFPRPFAMKTRADDEPR